MPGKPGSTPFHRAIMCLGLERARAFAATVALQGMITSIENKTVVHDCWQHSRATAIVAEYLAPFFRIHPEQAYLIQRASFSVNHCDAGFWLTHLWRLPGDS